MRRETFLSSVTSALLWNLLERLAGVVKHVVIAASFGLSAQLDTFYMAMALLGVVVLSWGKVAHVAAVPRMVSLRELSDGRHFRELAGGLLSLTLVFSVILTVIIYAFSGVLTSVAVGFGDTRGDLLRSAIAWLAPVCLLSVSVDFCKSVMVSCRRFSICHRADFLTAATLLVVILAFKKDANVLFWSPSVAIGVTFLYLAAHVLKTIGRPRSPMLHEARRCLSVVPGLLVLVGAQYIYVLSDRIFVSFLAQGAVAALSYGLIFVSMVPVAMARFGFISVVSEEANIDKRGLRLNDGISLAIFFTVAISMFLFRFGPTAISVALERGMFSSGDTSSVATAVAGYAWAILPMFLMALLQPIFHVERRLSVMAACIAVGLPVNVALNAIFLFGFQWGVGGVAAATSIAYWAILVAGLYGVGRLGYDIWWTRHARWLAWLVCAAGSVLVLDVGAMAIFGDINKLVRVVAGASGVVFAGLFAGQLYNGRERVLVQSGLRGEFAMVSGGY